MRVDQSLKLQIWNKKKTFKRKYTYKMRVKIKDLEKKVKSWEAKKKLDFWEVYIEIS